MSLGLNRGYLRVVAASCLLLACAYPAMAQAVVIERVTITVTPPTVYPLPPDGKSSAQLTAYDADGPVPEIIWKFNDSDTFGCQLTEDGLFTAGKEVGQVVVVGWYGGDTPGWLERVANKIVEVSCDGICENLRSARQRVVWTGTGRHDV